MDKNYFVAFSTPVKTEYLANYDEIITEIECNNFFCSLFLIDNFYVEVYLEKASNQVTKISIVNNEKVLHKYLENLNIRTLFDNQVNNS